MKRKTTKEILAESFRELAETRNPDKITIQNIADNCGYSVATFYRHFQDKYDLIAWDYAQGVAVIMNKIGKNGYTLRNTILDWLKQDELDKEYLSNLFIHTGGQHSFIRYMSETHIRELTAYAVRRNGSDPLDRMTELSIRLYCLGTICLSCEWILGRIDATVPEMAELFERSLPETLRWLLD